MAPKLPGALMGRDLGDWPFVAILVAFFALAGWLLR